MFSLLKENKMFRVLMSYQFFSSIGGAMFSMFILLSVHLIYNNPIYTGIAGFLMAAPHMFSFAVGPIVDRRSKVAIMRLTTFLEFLVLSLLAFTPLQENLGIVFTFAVIFAYSIAALFEAPAGTALLPQIVHEDKIMTANSLVNIVAMVGGLAIGAILYVSLGSDINFAFLYGFSAVFLVIAFAISWFLKNLPSDSADSADSSGSSDFSSSKAISPKGKTKSAGASYMKDLKEGARFLKGNVLLYLVIAAVTMALVAEMAYVNRPMFLEYHVGAQGYIIFVVMGLIGSIAASSLVGMLGNRFKVGQLVFKLLLLAGVVRIAFAFILPNHYVGGLITTVIYAAFATAVLIIFSSLTQKIPSNDMVGRVDTISTTFRAISVAAGALLGGFLGNIVPDVGHVFIYQGITLMVIGMFIMLVPATRKLPKMDEIAKAESQEA